MLLNNKLMLFTLLSCFSVCATLRGNSVSNEFNININNLKFSIKTPKPPERDFFEHVQSPPVEDDILFKKGDGVVVLKMHWNFTKGLFRNVVGVLELKVVLKHAVENNALMDGGLQQAIRSDFKHSLLKIGYNGDPFPVETITFNGTPWLKYRVPMLGMIEYAIGVSKSRYLTIEYSFIDNSGDNASSWHQDAEKLLNDLIESIRVEQR